MKFARYLDETQIPEWKKAYIDFKGLKKRITAIRKARQRRNASHISDSPQRAVFSPLSEDHAWQQSYGSLDHTSPRLQQGQSSHNLSNDQIMDPPTSERQRPLVSPQPVPPRPSQSWSEVILSRANSRADRSDPTMQRRPSISRLFATVNRGRSRGTSIRAYTTIESLYASLEPLEHSFFTYIDHELEKVNTFYNDRESEAIGKLSALKDQLRELENHRRVFYEAQASRDEPWTMLPRALGEALGISGTHMPEPADLAAKGNGIPLGPSQPRTVTGLSRDPAEYHQAKRRLKKAFQEFYRGLELLNDYRVLNLTGFRKALKKFEKVTRQPVQDLYMREKVQPCRFAFSGTMDDSMRDVENLFAARFEHGDRKKARRRLKSPFVHKTHHFTTFRSGVFVGVAIPALISGIYRSFQSETRQQIPEWGPLLEIYAALFIPIIFSLLIGINLLAWSQARINFAFIFEFDVRSAIDIREYFEVPTIMFATLCYAFWLSFFTVGSPNIAPTTWPVIWIGMAVAIMVNPLPIMSRSSRFWLVKNVSRLLISGTSRVEFADFWMGDQFCSLVFSLGHIYTVGCAYSNDWHNIWAHCNSAVHWPVPFMLVALPSLVRLVQSLRRWRDSKLHTHLINAGKYLSSVVTYAVYYTWRVRGSRYNYTFIIWCLFATLSSIYTTFWDLLMDWSFLRPHSPHRFLRPELVYTNNVLIYYFAIISNVIIRFIWTIYIPPGGPSNRVRAFIAAFLEMLRRFQWNFFRLENEQVGNTDQYRATREVPLPYSSRQADDDEDSDFGGDGGEVTQNHPTSGYKNGSRRSLRMSKVLSGGGPSSAQDGKDVTGRKTAVS